MNVIEQVREALTRIVHRTGQLAMPAEVSEETMMSLWRTATAALAALERYEVVEGASRPTYPLFEHHPTIWDFGPWPPSSRECPAILLVEKGEG